MIQDLLAEFVEAVNFPGRHAREWKKEHGGRVIGWLPADVPEELIHAAGFMPFGVPGGHSGVGLADAHLQGWVCSLARSCLALAVQGQLEFLDGLIIPHICDTTRMLGGIWQHVHPLPFMEYYRLPRQVERPSARRYLQAELQRLKSRLEEFSGREISPEQLNRSISLYNRSRSLLRTLSRLHRENPGRLGSRMFYDVVKSAMFMPREKYTGLLEKLVNCIQKEKMERPASVRIPLLLSGAVAEPPEILDMIDQAGGAVVADDMQTGYRYFAVDAPEDGDPLAALAVRQLNQIPGALFDPRNNPRAAFLVEKARNHGVAGVIFLHLKYCEPENYDYYDNQQALDRAGIPGLRLETELGTSSLEQMRTRLQAFLEMVEGTADGG
ncbi:2-hydroxyacyl-CoA dehydratase subunit D [Desulfotomaculum copahuensis]|uniref:Benzoyl-CoA reductase n=1 Tax=Desulfotomaculum copahuensis TaxID=1838280 RepID=A0A1B7LGR5_9FIRM|nr:2-hydroxyacyl-CoA dehydratase family protein [Desulfotomaculum copahuensis]OAT85260.1 hypothetical protein A6M21_06885 [Desulfotomaculum copahuensis]